MSAKTLYERTRQFTVPPLRDSSGASAIEFALVAPVLIVLAVGILVYGLYFGTAHSVQQLAADAARASVAGLSDTERTSIAQTHVATNAASYPLIAPDKITVAAGPLDADANQFEVTVEYDASELPIFGLDQLVPVPSPTIRRTSTIRRGGY